MIDLALLVIRVVAGTIFLAQGWRKVVEPADAPHGRANLASLVAERSVPRPELVALLVGLVELLGGIALLAGVLTRLAVVPLALVLVVAIFGYKWRQGFLGGWDWPWSVLGLVVTTWLLGAGGISVDAMLGLA